MAINSWLGEVSIGLNEHALADTSPIDNVQLTHKTELKRITARQSAVRFVVKRDITDEISQGFLQTRRRFSRLRIAIQAELATEVGPMVYPTRFRGALFMRRSIGTLNNRLGTRGWSASDK